ncbi:MAG TPA: helix-turn-helix transcriptional regulator [Casimicrobiaceae bacterium]|nr:helix-turn-helix transcriptional regulator [Casimicrobiaceae bacterium]
MRIVPTLTWALAGHPAEALDARLPALLDAIAQGRSLSAAVAACGISYRAAWGLLRDYEVTLGAPLVVLERGRGARLAPAGERLVEARHKAERRLARLLPALAVEIAADREQPRRRHSAVASLRIAASHDLALAALRDALPADGALALEITVMGSLHALQQLDEGRVELAGFHVAIGKYAASELAPFRRFLSPRRNRLVRLVDREQGFILPRRNPARVHGFADLASKGLRFVNRQNGSGTRVLIDRLLGEERVETSNLIGYGTEELTHAAVAATVASGAADAGFGLQAAAAQQGLAFVPRVRERYYLAVRTSALATPGVARLIELLRGPAFARVVRTLPGYRATAAGIVVGIDVLDRGPARDIR